MPTSTNSTGPIMDVWQNNLDIEMAKIRSVVQQYPYIAMVSLYLLSVLYLSMSCVCSSLDYLNHS